MPVSSSQLRTHAAAYAGLVALFLFVVIAIVRDVDDSIDLVRHSTDYARPPFYLGDANWGAVNLQPEAEAAGMKFGDAVLAADGRAIDGFFDYYGTLRQARARDRLRVQVQSPGLGNAVRDLSIDLQPYSRDSGGAPGVASYVFLGLRVVVLPVVCIALGFWVAAVRIGDPSAWLLLVLLLSFSAVSGAGPQAMFGRERFLQPVFAGFAAFRGRKGIPASLLMATLRAYVRGAQTIHHQADLTEVMTNLNKLVYESSDSNRYATFFYGEFDATSRVLSYVNGGHNAPMLFRRSDGGRDVVRLDTGGPVIGLIEDCSYTQGCVTLEPGDVLVAFTDGISEAMNLADEEWGDDRLMAAVRSNLSAPARELIDRIVRAADAFVAGAPQHDDMTTIVVRAS
jgi:hypothetical protein